MKNKKGITLIALVVTVIILLILAGVSVATIIKDDSIIKKAQEAKHSHILSQEREGVSLAVITAKTISKSENVEFNKFLLQEEVDNQFGKGVAIVGDRRPDNTFIITIENREYTVYDDKIESFELPEVIDPKPGELEKESEEIFLINSIEDLIGFSKMIESGDTFTGKTVKLVNTLDFNSDYSYVDPNNKETYGDYNGDGNIEEIKKELTTGSGFKPIGNGNAFSGMFEGNDKEIRNLWMSSNVMCSAFLPNVSKGTVKNFKLTGNVEVANTSTNAKYVGGIVGLSNNSQLINLVNDCNVTTLSTNVINVGGVVANNTTGRIDACSNNGEIICRNSNSFLGVGGVIGEHTSYDGVITNCYNTGKVSAYNGKRISIGGVAGYRASGRFLNCYNLSDIYAESDSVDRIEIGGTFGYTRYGRTINCYNKGNVTAKTNTETIQGGIIGNGNGPIMMNGYNSGKILGDVKKASSIGGDIGYNYWGAHENLFNMGVVESTLSTSRTGGVAGHSSHDNNKSYIKNSMTNAGISNKAVNGKDLDTVITKENLTDEEIMNYLNVYVDEYKARKDIDYELLKKWTIIDGQLVHEN